MSDKGFRSGNGTVGMSEEAKPRPRTTMDRIFDSPFLYRLKVSTIRMLTRPIALILMRNRFSPDNIILREIPNNSTVYEIGCGDGNHFRLFRDAGRHIDLAGSDYNGHMVDYCRSHYPSGKWEYYRGGRYPHPDNAFDFCIVRNVLHHIVSREEIVQTVREAVRIARNVVLIEPLQSENPLLRYIKSVYWRVTDGGLHYQRLAELHRAWSDAGATIVWEIATEPLRQAYACRLTKKNG